MMGAGLLASDDATKDGRWAKGFLALGVLGGEVCADPFDPMLVSDDALSDFFRLFSPAARQNNAIDSHSASWIW